MADETTEEPDWARSVRQSGALIDPDGVFDLSEPVSLWIFVRFNESRWFSTTRPLRAGAPPKSCTPRGTLVVDGVGRTDANGRQEYLVSDFICKLNVPMNFEPPTILLATAAVDQPIYLTSQSTIIQFGADLRLRFFSWQASGRNAPETSFRWHLTAAVAGANE